MSPIFFVVNNNNELSKHQPSGPMLGISQNVLFFLSVHFLRYHLTVFLPPLPKIGCAIFLEIQNPWGKVMERSGLRFELFCLEPRFPMD